MQEQQSKIHLTERAPAFKSELDVSSTERKRRVELPFRYGRAFRISRAIPSDPLRRSAIANLPKSTLRLSRKTEGHQNRASRFKVPNTLTAKATVAVRNDDRKGMETFQPAAVGRKVDSLNKCSPLANQWANLLTYMDGKSWRRGNSRRKC